MRDGCFDHSCPYDRSGMVMVRANSQRVNSPAGASANCTVSIWPPDCPVNALGISYVDGVNSFYAALFTDNGCPPGDELRRWDNLSSNQTLGGCCGLFTISGISGIELTAGETYFLVLGPTDVNDTSFFGLEP